MGPACYRVTPLTDCDVDVRVGLNGKPSRYTKPCDLDGNEERRACP